MAYDTRATHLFEEVFAVHALRLCGCFCCTTTEASAALHTTVCGRCGTSVASRHHVLITLSCNRGTVHAVGCSPPRAPPNTPWLLRWRRVVMHQVRLVQRVGVRSVCHGRRHRVPMGTRVRHRARSVRGWGGVCPMGSCFIVPRVSPIAPIWPTSVLPCTPRASWRVKATLIKCDQKSRPHDGYDVLHYVAAVPVVQVHQSWPRWACRLSNSSHFLVLCSYTHSTNAVQRFLSAMPRLRRTRLCMGKGRIFRDLRRLSIGKDLSDKAVALLALLWSLTPNTTISGRCATAA